MASIRQVLVIGFAQIAKPLALFSVGAGFDLRRVPYLAGINIRNEVDRGNAMQSTSRRGNVSERYGLADGECPIQT